MQKVVFVTGSSKGIGKSIAKSFANLGYKVAINGYRDIPALNNTLDELQKINKNTIAIQGDISNYETCKKIFDEIDEKLGNIDILINNAGISHIGLFNEMIPSLWNALINTNINGMINCSHIAVQNMIRKKDGIIINISSIWGDVGASCEVVYSATKGAINSFTKALAKELAPSGIRVNAISCGVIDTIMNNTLSDNEKNELADDIPCGRFGSTDEVSNLATYLAKDSPSYLTGQCIRLDGGYI